MRESLYIVMPAYNEEANIEKVIEQWYPILEGKGANSRLVVADSGSSDNTHKILVALQEKYTKLVILSDTLKEHGPKLMALYDYAVKQDATYVFQTDSDGQTNPAEFEYFWNKRNEYDAIVGNRTRRGDGVGRFFVEKVVCLLLFVFLGVIVPDANAPFRLIKIDLLKKYLSKIPFDYNIPNIILVAYFKRYKEKLLFREISFQSRKAGKNSINFGKIFKIGLKAVKDFNYFKKDMRQ